MRKSNKVIIVFVLCIIFVGATIPFSLIIFGGQQSAQSNLVHIYVNSTIYSSLSSDVTQYKQDVETQGYRANIINWSINDVTQLKNHLISARSNGLIGAV
ncbi:MAG: hypothetical protein ACFE9S_10060, partial [Candidatus Hermodarchaeota archaeon]